MAWSVKGGCGMGSGLVGLHMVSHLQSIGIG